MCRLTNNCETKSKVLHQACKRGNITLTRLLIEEGAPTLMQKILMGRPFWALPVKTIKSITGCSIEELFPSKFITNLSFCPLTNKIPCATEHVTDRHYYSCKGRPVYNNVIFSRR
ncbi:MAG: hypothetical protein QG624_892 [Pseudomonadota bacterium]|jgi:hypothetical protein|nr:hypothetical protein [Pseudomonadota bacterium]